MDKHSLKVAGSEPAKPGASSERDGNPGNDISSGELGQLQEILFGQQQRSNVEQLSALQLQFAEQMESLSQSVTKRLDALSQSIESSTSTLEKKLSELEARQNTAMEDISKATDNQNSKLLGRIDELGKSASEGAQQLESELALQKNALSTQMASIENKLQKEMSQSVNNLQSAKLDKQNLASLLNDLSGKLSGSTTA